MEYTTLWIYYETITQEGVQVCMHIQTQAPVIIQKQIASDRLKKHNVLTHTHTPTALKVKTKHFEDTSVWPQGYRPNLVFYVKNFERGEKEKVLVTGWVGQ